MTSLPKLSTLRSGALFAVLLWPVQAGASENFLTIMSGNKLYELCGPGQDSQRTYTVHEIMSREYCNAYITGVIDEAGEAFTGVRPSPFCLKSITLSQIHEVVAMSLRNHPEDRHFGAQRSVISALAEAFPCK